MTKKKVTIKQVAEKSGVSITTVSQVLNSKGERFSKRTIEKIEMAKKELGYKPDYFASSLKNKTTKTIGIIIPDLSNSFFNELVRTMQECLFNQGFITTICDMKINSKFKNSYLSELVHRGVDGFIIASQGITNQEIENVLKKNNIPYITLDQKQDKKDLTIKTDDYQGGELVGQYFKELGHSKVAVILPPNASKNITERFLGISSIIKNISIIHTSLSKEGGYQAAKKVIEIDVSAIFAINDEIAIGVMKGLRELNKLIPDDYSLIGYDNIPMSSYVYPTLTTVSQPINELAQVAVNTMIIKLNGKKLINPTKKLPVELIKRNSTLSL